MTGFKSGGSAHRQGATASEAYNNEGARFAAANLPPLRGPAGSGRADAGPEANPDILAAKSAAARYDALFGTETNSRRRMPMSVWIMALVFLIGACAGLFGSRLFAPTAKPPKISVPPVALSVPATETAGTDEETQARAMRGIRASELPYDGRMPEAGEEMPEPDAASAPLPATGLQKQVRNADQAAAAADTSPAPPKPAPPTPAKPQKTEQLAAHKPARPSGKDREIERMRGQADAELRGKAESASSTSSRTASSQQAATPSRTQLITAKLNSCDRRSSNIILREHCRWQICNGMWGKHGCPSYQTASRDPY